LDPSWGVELACLFAGRVSELADETLVGSAEEVGKLEILIQEAVLVKVADQPPQLLVRDLRLANFTGEIDMTQNTGQRLVVRVLQPCQCFVQLVSNV
jgi:hypothetical protein